MIVISLYKTIREDGGISVSPNETDEPHGYRLIASDGMAVKKDDIIAQCIDTDSVEGWEEIAYTEKAAEKEDMRSALSILEVK